MSTLAQTKTLFVLNPGNFEYMTQRNILYSPAFFNHLKANDQLFYYKNETNAKSQSDYFLTKYIIHDDYDRGEKINNDTIVLNCKFKSVENLLEGLNCQATLQEKSESESQKIEIFQQSENSPETLKKCEKGKSEKELVKVILDLRQKAAQKIQNFYKNKIFIKKLKIFAIIQKIILDRFKKIKMIQNRFRTFCVQKNIKKVIKMSKENYTIFYHRNINDNSSTCSNFETESVRMIIKQEKSDKIFIFTYNEYLDCFLVFIKKSKPYAKKKIYN